MTTDEFKKLKPEYKDIDGDQLWDAMTEYVLRQQQGSEIIKSIMPIWKTHTLRWLLYRRIPNFEFNSHKIDKYVSAKKCSKCKWGVNSRMTFIQRLDDGTYKYFSICPHCGKDFIEEPNTNFTHRLYKFAKWWSKLFWTFLDRLHIVRSLIHDRYDIFGDEGRYVTKFSLNFETGKKKNYLAKRKWWEYIIIEKPSHNF